MRPNCTPHIPLPYADPITSILTVATGLPSGLVDSLTWLAERILPFTNGDFRPSQPPMLLEKLTDQLLVVASDAVAAVAAAASPPLSGKAKLRLLAWVLADARGAGQPLDRALAETVGKRLEKQAQKVRDILAAASAHASQARDAAHKAAAQDASLVAALASELAAIDTTERNAYASARDEVYIGFHELGSGSTAASPSLTVSVEAPPQLPGWVSQEPEEGPARDELLKRALARIIDQEVMIDQLREANEWQESSMRRERLRMQQQLWEQERVQMTLNNELWDADRKLSAAEDRLEEMDEECVRDRFAELERDLARSRAGNDVLRKRVLEEVALVRELEAEIARLKGEA